MKTTSWTYKEHEHVKEISIKTRLTGYTEIVLTEDDKLEGQIEIPNEQVKQLISSIKFLFDNLQ